MQERVNAFGVSEAEINQAGDDQIEVNLPGVEDAEEAAAQVGSTAQLFFYDWEANILDEDCKTDPDQNAQQPPAGRRAADRGRAGLQVHGGRHRQGPGPARRRLAGRPVRGRGWSRASTSSTRRQEAVQQRPVLQLARGRAGLARRRTSARTPRSSRSRPACSCCAPSAPSEDGPKPDRWWVIQDRPGLSRHRDPQPGAELRPGRQQPADRHLQLHGQGPQGVPGDHAQGRPARRRQRARRAADPDLAALRDRARQRADLRAVHQLAGEPGRHRRRDRRPDLRHLHDQVRAEPGQAAQDRRPAAEADRDLALAGLRDARCPGARPGPEGRHRGLRHRRALPDPLLPRAGRHRDVRAVHLRAVLLRAGQADPDHADAAGHRGPDPDARRRGRREHRRLRTRQRGGTGREIGLAPRSSRATARA